MRLEVDKPLNWFSGEKISNRLTPKVGRGADYSGDTRLHQAAEYAVAKWLYESGAPGVKWHRDCGNYDVSCKGHRIEVRSSEHPNAKHLIWWASKAHLLHSRENFDDMVFVKTWQFPTVEIVFFCSRENFLANHKVANHEDKLDNGTLYIEEGLEPEEWLQRL